MDKEEKKKKHREYMRGYYQKPSNRLKCKRRVMDRLKELNYSPEKTVEQKILRGIKRQTRYYFPLIGHKCEFCGKPAEERHHNTSPIQFDRFNYVCHICHIKLERKNKRGWEEQK